MKTDINYRAQPFSKYSKIETVIFKGVIFKGNKIILRNKTEHFKNTPYFNKEQRIKFNHYYMIHTFIFMLFYLRFLDF